MNSVHTPALLHAIAMLETSGGRNNYPRIERSYMPEGYAVTIQGRIVTGTGTNFRNAVPKRWDYWLHPDRQLHLAASASWGVLQLMYHTAADRGFKGPPLDLAAPKVCLEYGEKQLVWLARYRGCVTPRDFLDAWNTGSPRDKNVPTRYIDEGLEHYAKALKEMRA